MPDFAIKEREPQTAATIHAEVPAAEIRRVYDRGFPELMRVVQASGAQMLGAPFGYYPRMPSDTIEVVIGIPIDRKIAAEAGVEPFTLPGGKAVVGTHVGPYDGLADTYRKLTEWAQREGIALGPVMWESYVTDPTTAPPSEWRTEIVWPVA
jgi:effector-binding domain-containing protein